MPVASDPPPPAVKPLVGVSELARESGICRKTIRQHLAAGHWPGLQVGKRRAWRVPRSVLDALKAGVDPAAP